MKALFWVIAGSVMAGGVHADVLISEYVEGGGFNKALELYNGGADTVSLDGYRLERYSNGGTDASGVLALDGESLAAGAVLVIVSSQAGAPLDGLGDISSGVISHNGDDAYVLRGANGVVDSLGRVGEDPGSAWGSGDTTTVNQTLRRLETVSTGDTVIDDAFDPADQWRAFPEDTLDGLGVYGEGAGDGGGDGGDPPPALGACGDADTPLSVVQGSGAGTPLDDNPDTSEGLFVYAPDAAIAELAGALGPAWRFVAHGEAGLGSDANAVGLLYRDDVVAEAGEAATLDTGAFGNETNRQPLAQSFRLLNNDEVLTLVVNHFKSKGSCPDDGLNADQDDGQSCWNAERTQAAQDQLAWLAGQPTGVMDQDVLVLGDLNAYALEDPVRAFQHEGFVDLLTRFQGDQAYSYIFDGETGHLDHALASPSLDARVVDAGAWHINADEPRALNYNQEFKSDSQIDGFFAADAYRSSDHDPLHVDLNLTADDSGGGGGLGWLLLVLVWAAGRHRRA